MGSAAPVPYDVLEKDSSLEPPSAADLYKSPLEALSGSTPRGRSSDLSAPPRITFTAFRRSERARSFAPQGGSAIADEKDEDEGSASDLFGDDDE